MARAIYDAVPLILRYDGEWDILLMLGKCVGVKSVNYHLHEAKIEISIAIPKWNIHYRFICWEVNGFVLGSRMLRL